MFDLTIRVPSKRSFLIGLLSLVYFAALIYIVNLHELAFALGRIPTAALLGAGALVIISNMFAFARSGAVLSILGYRTGWHDLFIAFSSGNISNLPLNVVGQSLTRAFVLERVGIPSSVTVMATYIERFLAAGLLFFFSLISLWLLFGRIDFDLDRGGGDVIFTIAAMAMVCGVLGLTVFRVQIQRGCASYARWLLKLWPSAILTILCHASGLGAYLVLLSNFDPQRVSTGMVAALVIVMFVTSLPVSFAGWGLRELSAASALGFIGISSEVSIAAAIVIGLLFLAVTGIFGAAGLLLEVTSGRTAPHR